MIDCSGMLSVRSVSHRRFEWNRRGGIGAVVAHGHAASSSLRHPKKRGPADVMPSQRGRGQARRARWRGSLNTSPAAERLIVIERSWGKARPQAALPNSNGTVMGTLPSSAEKVLSRHRGTMSPLCAQCRKSMVLVICEPDFHDFHGRHLSMPGMWAIGSRGSRSIGRDLGPSRQVCSQNLPKSHPVDSAEQGASYKRGRIAV